MGVQDPVLWAWPEIFSSPKRYLFQNNTLTDSPFKRHRKRSRCGPFEAEHPKEVVKLTLSLRCSATYGQRLSFGAASSVLRKYCEIKTDQTGI